LAKDFTYPNQQGYSSFGWGRRVCPGQQVAEQSLYITIARILWGFNIKKARHADGTEHTYDTYAVLLLPSDLTTVYRKLQYETIAV
jgi:cytochrome P450